jgi:aminoglycoside phosphotransferase (APT) family kinase protein
MTHKAWHADIIINEAQVKNCLAIQFPELLPLEVICIDAGWDNLVFLVNQKIIFRFPRRKIAVALIEQENQVLKNLQSCITLQIPNPEFIGHPSKDFPYPFHGYTLIPGVAAERADLTPSQRRKSKALKQIFKSITCD